MHYIAQMIHGTAEVRRCLGTHTDRVTEQQIEDALWHYYYDVDKAVSYLTTKYINPKVAKLPAQKKNKSGGRFLYSHTNTLAQASSRHRQEDLDLSQSASEGIPGELQFGLAIDRT